MGLSKLAIILAVILCVGIGLCSIVPLTHYLPDNNAGLFIMFAEMAGAVTIPVCGIGLLAIGVIAIVRLIRRNK